MKRNIIGVLVAGMALLAGCATLPRAHAGVQVATFVSDATPPMGAPLCGGDVKPAESVDDPLHARGIVILPGGQRPIVLVSVEWVGIANGAQDRWREALAEAAGTTVERVNVHVTHVHDAPFADDTVEGLLAQHGMAGAAFDVAASHRAVEAAAAALKKAMQAPRNVTHVGHGQGVVKEVASNRRILGPDGKVKAVRWSGTADPAVRAEPEGTIDPLGRVLSFWDGETPVAALTYYACHPQSKYGLGKVSADVPGVARAKMEAALGCPIVHFNGAAGNVTHGKYNEGNIANRPILAGRLFDGLHAAWNATQKYPVTPGDIVLDARTLALPPRPETVEADERAVLKDTAADAGQRRNAAVEVAWIDRAREGVQTPLSCLHLGPIRVLHMPGELFVEYQLAAQQMRPDLPVVMAAYGEYGMGYIGTCVAYPQGGYETQLHVSRTAPEVEKLLMDEMRSMLGAGK
jgi:hypothetical protein